MNDPDVHAADLFRQAANFTKGPYRGPIPTVRVGEVSACLINGVFGDPLLQVQLLHRRRNLLFDLGDPGRMSAREAHQVTDIFLSHTHADHIGGFLWFLRSRIGPFPACRIVGPPGVAGQIAGMVEGVLWDRIEDRAPAFEISEWHGDHLQRFRVTAGETGADRVGERALEDGLVRQEAAFSVRAVQLDHGTPVLAYAFEPAARFNVCPDRLQAQGLVAGPWLQDLKQSWLAGRHDDVIAVPDGSRRSVAQLREEVLLVSPGQKLVYATDLADTEDNRLKLSQLACDAHSLFCESAFMIEHREQAQRTGHLTTEACADIARRAGVGQLLPFHFSKRYIKHVDRVYRELSSLCEQTVVPSV